MASQLPAIFNVWDIAGSLRTVLPIPVIAAGVPSTSMGATQGQVYIDSNTAVVYMLTSGTGANNNAVWTQLSNAGGAGVFTTLTVSPGPTNLNVASTQSVNILTGASSGPVHINDGTGTGAIGIGNGAAASLTLASGGLSAIDGAAIDLVATSAGAASIDLQATNAAGGITLEVGTGGLHMGNQATATTLDLGNVVPTAARTTNIAVGAIGSAIADTVNLGTGASNFAGASKVVNVATGDATIGTVTLELATGACPAGQTHTVDIGTGTGGGTKRVNIGNADGLTAVTVSGTANINNNAAASTTNIATGTTTGLVTIGNVANGTGVAIASGAGVSVTTQANTIAASGLNITQGAATAQILVGAGNPTNGVTLGVQGSIYINTTAAAAADRLWIASAANTWVFFTASA